MSLEKWRISPAVRESYYGPAMFDPWAEWLVSSAPPQEGDSVVDLACATGAVTRHLAKVVGDGGSVIGSDIDDRMLEFASSLPKIAGAEIRWEQADICDMGFESASFDAVYCAQGLQFVPDRVAAASEIHRILKPGGRLIASIFRGLQHNPAYLAISDSVKNVTGVTVGSSPFGLGDATELEDYIKSGGFGNPEIKSHSIELRFPNAEMFIRTSALAGIGGLPGLSDLDEKAQESLFEAVSSEFRTQLKTFTHGDLVRFPSSVHRVIAVK